MGFFFGFAKLNETVSGRGSQLCDQLFIHVGESHKVTGILQNCPDEAPPDVSGSEVDCPHSFSPVTVLSATRFCLTQWFFYFFLLDLQLVVAKEQLSNFLRVI